MLCNPIETFFYDPGTARDLDIALAALIDAGKHLVKATYHLEGDGPLVFSCYERLSALAHAIAIWPLLIVQQLKQKRRKYRVGNTCHCSTKLV